MVYAYLTPDFRKHISRELWYIPAFNEKSKNHCAQLQCIASTLYSLTSINCVVTVRGVAEILDGRTSSVWATGWMSVQFFLHIFNKKFWLQFICNKLISTTAHESVKIISTKWVIHISHLISVNIFLENFDTFFGLIF
jgi:hypothetical protein